MNTIGIDHNLDRARIRKLLAIGLFAAILTGIGDFILGYGHAESMEGYGLAASVLASAPNLADLNDTWHSVHVKKWKMLQLIPFSIPISAIIGGLYWGIRVLS